jgi:hypothetical protein
MKVEVQSLVFAPAVGGNSPFVYVRVQPEGRFQPPFEVAIPMGEHAGTYVEAGHFAEALKGIAAALLRLTS